MITDENGVYPALKGDGQYDWLVSELQRLAPQRKALERAVILACHHPPVSADLTHGGTTGLSDDLDRAFTAAGLWPDAVLSGHAHIYQRFSRNLNGRQIPYVVAGSGGHNALVPTGEHANEAPQTWNEYTLLVGPEAAYGYLTLSVDMTNRSAPVITIAFTAPGKPSAADRRQRHLELTMADHVALAGSARPRRADAERISDVAPDERIEVTVALSGPALPEPSAGQSVSREQLEAQHGRRSTDDRKGEGGARGFRPAGPEELSAYAQPVRQRHRCSTRGGVQARSRHVPKR